MTTRIPPDDELPPIEVSDAARALLAQVSDKWSVLILSALCSGPKRFNALRRRVGVTQKALTQTLRRLERSGIVARRVIPGSPPAVEYRGTALGFSVAPPMRALFGWAADKLPQVEQARRAYDARRAADDDALDTE